MFAYADCPPLAYETVAQHWAIPATGWQSLYFEQVVKPLWAEMLMARTAKARRMIADFISEII